MFTVTTNVSPTETVAGALMLTLAPAALTAEIGMAIKIKLNATSIKRKHFILFIRDPFIIYTFLMRVPLLRKRQ